MKTIITLAFASIFLVACGGGGGSSSSSGFAPANAAAFEINFTNQAITLNSGDVLTILPNKKFSRSGTTTITVYAYSKTAANTATLSYTTAGEECTQTLTFTSAIAGNGSEECNEVSQGAFTFAFGFAPANTAAFEAKFVGQTITLSSSDGTSDTSTITRFEGNESYSRTSANTATISNSTIFREDDIVCSGIRLTFSWTSAFAGTNRVIGDCRDTNTGVTATVDIPFTFRFSGSN